MTSNCGQCDTRGGPCQDCVVTVVAARGAARHLGAEELRALGVLADAGMVPPLRLSLPGSIQPGSIQVGSRIPSRARTWVLPDTKAS